LYFFYLNSQFRTDLHLQDGSIFLKEDVAHLAADQTPRTLWEIWKTQVKE
jgi:hypothetical protein